jgi:hypothetical protein
MSVSLTAGLVLSVAAGAPPAFSAKPCVAPLGVSQETLLAQAEIARGLAGTDAVAHDPAGSCITISVRTEGTARLVALLLRGVKVPAEAVRFQVDSASAPGTAVRRS